MENKNLDTLHDFIPQLILTCYNVSFITLVVQVEKIQLLYLSVSPGSAQLSVTHRSRDLDNNHITRQNVFFLKCMGTPPSFSVMV